MSASVSRSGTMGCGMGAPTRDVNLDVIRGLCVVSMVIGHLADGSPLYQVTHGQVWVDGATGFVLLAGLVLGMVQRRAGSTSSGTRQLARRARVVWSTHVALVVLALVLAPWSAVSSPATPAAGAVGGWGSALWQTLTLRLNPVEVDILSLYVVLFGVAVLAVPLLRAGRAWLVAGLSLALYVVGLVAPESTSLPRYVGGPGSHFDVLAWQALFVSALVVGWYWNDPKVREWLLRRGVLLGATAVVVASAVLHLLVERVGVLASLPPVEGLVRATFDNSVIGPGRIALAWCALLVVYRGLRSARTAVVRVPVGALCEPLGRRSLAAYVVLSVADLVLQVVDPYDSNGWAGVQWVVVTIGIAWAYARLRDAGRLRLPRARVPTEVTAAPGTAVVPSPDPARLLVAAAR